MTRADAWIEADPTVCPECGRDSCEEHLPLLPDAGATPLSAAVERERIRREVRRIVDAEERPRVLVPPFETLESWLAKPDVQTAYRIDGWLPREGRAILAAQFKAGKTTLRDNYIRSLVDGDLFLDRAAVTPITGSLVLIDTEMSEPTLKRWLRAQGIRACQRVCPIALRGRAASFNLLDASVRAQWARRLREVNAEHLVLDCLRPVLDAIGLDEQREAGRFLVALDALLREADIPEALVIHHMGHSNERSRGDSRLRDWPDAEWRLMRRNDDPSSARFIAAYGRDVDVPESELLYDKQTRHLTIKGGSRRDADVREALTVVKNFLMSAPEPLSGREVKEALKARGVSRDKIEAALRLGRCANDPLESAPLVVQQGPNNVYLYSVSARVSGSVRMPAQDTAK